MLKRGTNAKFRYEIALAMGVKIETRIEPALSMAVDTDRAALTVSAPMDRAALSRLALSMGVKFRVSILHPRIEPAQSVAVDTDRAALAVAVRIYII